MMLDRLLKLKKLPNLIKKTGKKNWSRFKYGDNIFYSIFNSSNKKID